MIVIVQWTRWIGKSGLPRFRRTFYTILTTGPSWIFLWTLHQFLVASTIDLGSHAVIFRKSPEGKTAEGIEARISSA